MRALLSRVLRDLACWIDPNTIPFTRLGPEDEWNLSDVTVHGKGLEITGISSEFRKE